MASSAPGQPRAGPAYRPEIDGLRALAVVPVALFHARVTGFAGGFVGVDVFFVLSGYLITQVLLRGAGQPGALVRFYERRARRIIPALLPVLAFTFFAAWAIFVPDDFRRYSQALGATGLFASNVLFAMRTDYFAGDEGFTPLIHTWSLSIEEQFYLLFPLALLAAIRLRPKWVLPGVMLVMTASFVLAATLASTSPQFAFNLLPTRAWELLAGAACALLPAPQAPRRLPGLAGLALTIGGFAVIGPDTAAPGPLFLIPVAGAALIVRYATHGTLAARLLSWRPFVLLGRVSYGFYLWHQALLAFVIYTHFDAPSMTLRMSAVAIALLLATLSYLLIELPVRAGRALRSRTALATVCIAGLVAAAVAGLAGHTRLIGARSTAHMAKLGGAIDEQWDGASRLPDSGPIPFLLYGDSHAAQYYPSLREQLGNGALVAGSGCMSLPRATNWQPGSDPYRDCRTLYATAQDIAQRRQVEVVVWAQRWERDLFASPGGRPLGSSSGQAAPVLLAELAAVRAALPRSTRLLIVGNSPTAWAAGDSLSRGFLRCRVWLDVACPTSFPAEQAEGRAVNAILRQFADETAGVSFVDAAAVLCNDGRCPVLENGRLYYNDGSHLTRFAADRVAERVARVVAFEGSSP